MTTKPAVASRCLHQPLSLRPPGRIAPAGKPEMGLVCWLKVRQRAGKRSAGDVGADFAAAAVDCAIRPARSLADGRFLTRRRGDVPAQVAWSSIDHRHDKCGWKASPNFQRLTPRAFAACRVWAILRPRARSRLPCEPRSPGLSRRSEVRRSQQTQASVESRPQPRYRVGRIHRD